MRVTSKTKYLTDTVIHNSLCAESKGLVYRELIRAYPRNQALFTPNEVKAAIVASDGLDSGIRLLHGAGPRSLPPLSRAGMGVTR